MNFKYISFAVVADLGREAETAGARLICSAGLLPMHAECTHHLQ